MGRHAENMELQEYAYNAENKAKTGAQVENMHEYM